MLNSPLTAFHLSMESKPEYRAALDGSVWVARTLATCSSVCILPASQGLPNRLLLCW